MSQASAVASEPKRTPPEIEVGDYLKDNDPRMKHRGPLQVIVLMKDRVKAMSRAGRITTHLRKSIHSDGRPRKSGFDLCKEQP